MRIIKDLNPQHLNEKFYDKMSHVGQLIDNLRLKIGNEDSFLKSIKEILFWDYPKFSLWAIDDVMNYIDTLLSQYKQDPSENEQKLITLFSFLHKVLSNCSHKDIFSSFDHLEEIFINTFSLKVKAIIIDLYQLYAEVKKSMHEAYLKMIDHNWFIIQFRPIFINFMLDMMKTDGTTDELKTTFYDEIERMLLQVLKDAKKKLKDFSHPLLLNQGELKQTLRQTCWEGLDMCQLKNNFFRNKTKEHSIEEEILLNTVFNFFLICSELKLKVINKQCINDNYKPITRFVVNMLNLLITGSHRKSNTPLISEHYIEKYLKQVLEVITSSFDLEMKSIFIQATIGFVTYFDGYESILFQNGLFHSILSDLTSDKFVEKHDLEVLTYEESINQDFLNTILIFLHKTSSFKEIPVHFLNKVLEVPKGNTYPFRIDNVIFSLKKKRALDEAVLNELVLPRLIYELTNFWVMKDDINYLWRNINEPTRVPTVFERSCLIQKLFKILYSIFETNTSLSSIRYYEERMINAVDQFIKTATNFEGTLMEIEETSLNQTESDSLLVACIDFISKICNFIPSKIPSLIERGTLKAIFVSLSERIPCQNNVLNLIFHLIHSVHFNEDGRKFISESHGKKVIDTLFKSLIQSEYIFTNVFTPNSFLSDEFFAPYTSFLRMDNMNVLILHFFKTLDENVIQVKEGLLLTDRTQLQYLTHKIQILSQFYMNITKEDMDYLANENIIDLRDNVMRLIELLFCPMALLAINSNVLTKNMIELFEKKAPEEIIQKIIQMISDENAFALFTETERNKISMKMVLLGKQILKRIYIKLTDKTIAEKLVYILTKKMIQLVDSQSNLNMYMSPVNDCILVINQKHYYKFLSSKLNPELRRLLVDQTSKNVNKTLSTVVDPIIEIFDEETALAIKFKHDFECSMRVEISDGNNPFTTDVLDQEAKLLINSHLPVLELYQVIGKNTKNPTESTIKMWMVIARCLVEMISSLDPIKKTNEDIEHTPEPEFVRNMIYFINMMNNINIVFNETKKNSNFVTYYFIKLGGVERIFDIAVYLLKVSEIFEHKETQPLTILLLIKNLWNIITSIMLRLFKINFDTTQSFPVIFIQENANSMREISSKTKLLFLTIVHDNFILGKSGYNMAKISKLSFSLHSLLFSIIDSCLVHYKYISEEGKESISLSKIIEDGHKMGFNKAEVLQAFQQGYRDIQEIVEYITNNPNGEEDEEEENSEDVLIPKPKNEADKVYNFDTDENLKLCILNELGFEPFKQRYSIDTSNFHDEFHRIWLDVYRTFIEEDDATSIKISQQRKMNVLFRIKDFVKNEDDNFLVSFLKEIFIMERENFIELQSDSSSTLLLGKVHQNWMLINYIISKDRLRYNHIFEGLNMEEIAKFFDEFKVIENCIMTIKFIQSLPPTQTTRGITSECLTLIYISFHFITFYVKQQDRSTNTPGTIKLPVEEYKGEYMNLFYEMIENQNKCSPKTISLDEQNMILLLSTVIDNFTNDEHLAKFIERGGMRNLLKIKKESNAEATCNFNDNKFKRKVVLDEIFRLFMFRIFEDEAGVDALIESVVFYIFANYSFNNKSTDPKGDKHEINLEDFLITSKTITNRTTFNKVVKRLCEIEKRAEKTPKKRRKAKDTESSNVVIRLKSEYNHIIDSMLNEMKNGPAKEAENAPIGSPKQKPLNNLPVKESARKKIEEKIGKISKQFHSARGKMLSALIKHIWDVTLESEKEVEKCFAKNSSMNLQQKYLIDLDCCLLSLGSLIHTYPNVLPLILKYNKQKEKNVSFLSFLIRKVFYVLSFYKNCIDTKEDDKDYLESLAKDKEDITRKLGYEANSHQAALESLRNHNIINFIIQALCYKRRNMNTTEAFLIHKTRKKILQEINLIICEVGSKLKDEMTQTNGVSNKNYILYRVCIFSLFAMTEFYDSSHVYSHLNPFEIAKALFTKDNDILKNISDLTKGLSLSNPQAKVCHKLTVLFLSELFKFIRINSKMKVGSAQDELDRKVTYKTVTNENGDLIIEADVHNAEGENENLSDVIMEDIENRLREGEVNELHDEEMEEDDEDDLEGEEDEEEEDDEEDDEMEDEDDEEGLFSSFSSSNLMEIDNEEEEEDEGSEDEEEEGSNPISNNLLNIIEANNEENEFDEDEFDEGEEDGNEEDLPHHEVSVQFNDDANEYHLEDEEDQSEAENEEESENSLGDEEDVRPRNLRVDNILLGNLRFTNNFMHRLQNERQPILVNNHNNIINSNEESGDEVLFVNPYIEKPTKGEINGYFEDTITFPFILTTNDDDIFGFSRNAVRINFINKIKRKHVESINCVFQFRYISPFNRKNKRNMYFALNGSKEKVIIAYNKEITKISEVAAAFGEIGLPIPGETVEEQRDTLCKEMGIELKEVKGTNEKRSRSNSGNSAGVASQFKTDKEGFNPNSDLLNDKSILDTLPAEMRDDVVKMNNEANQAEDNLINTQILQDELDPEILEQVSPDLLPQAGGIQTEGDNQNNNTANTSTNPAADLATFIYSLPPDLRQEVLMTIPPEQIMDLPVDLREECLSLSGMFYIEGNIRDNPFLNPRFLPGSLSSGFNYPSYKKSPSVSFLPPKYTIDKILTEQKHNKEHSAFILNTFDDEFIENLISFNIKFIYEASPKSKIATNQYWILVRSLIQNTGLRHKILDILFILWICDSMCIKKLIADGMIGKINKNLLLRNLTELYIDSKVLEEFFYDDFDQFVKTFCSVFKAEMKKFFLETFYLEKGDFVTNANKTYSITKNSMMIKELLGIKYEKAENVLSNLISLMLINSKSDIKKIFALKIFTNIITSCLKSDTDLRISPPTIEKIIELYYNFETILEINKDRKSNNPTQLLSELIKDTKSYNILLTILQNQANKLSKQVSYEMDNFFTLKKISIDIYARPLPENVLFKIIKLINQINVGINKVLTKEKSILEEKEIHQKEKVEQLAEFIKQINSSLILCWEKLDFLLFEINKLVKEDQKVIDPKLNRLIPYLEAFITLSHLQFLPEGNKNKEYNQFIMEKTYGQTPKRTPQLLQIQANIEGGFTEFFYRFCEKNKKTINLILRRYPKMFPAELLLKTSHFLDLENKKKSFKLELKKLKTGREMPVNLRVRREHLFMDSYNQLKGKKPEEIRGKLTITFAGEEAVDAGGVKREWFLLLSREMFNPNFMLFKLAANGNTYMPNSESGLFEADHLELFSFVGRVMAKAIYDGFMLDCYFTRSFYKLICNIPLTYHDMEDYDPEYFKNLKWLLETDISDMGELFTFSYVEDKFGQVEVIDLIENGSNIGVTEENKFEYVQKLCSAKLFHNIRHQVEAFKKGFYEIIPMKLISIFDHREIELVISGLPTVDLVDLKNNTIYENYSEETQIIKWFWEILESYDNNERTEFIQFVTGSSKVPMEGFAALQGIGGINKFKMSKVFDKNFDRLPSAHTCTNQLDLPEYPSKEILMERINLAFKEGKVGFGFI